MNIYLLTDSMCNALFIGNDNKYMFEHEFTNRLGVSLLSSMLHHFVQTREKHETICNEVHVSKINKISEFSFLDCSIFNWTQILMLANVRSRPSVFNRDVIH